VVLFRYGRQFSVTVPALVQSIWKRFRMDMSGQDLIEYSLAAGMVAVAAVASAPPISAMVSDVFNKIGSIVNASIN
jgi:pilus assembly protein Flp/PilA